MTNLEKYNKDMEEEFDKKFGKAGEEMNCDSIGRSAGCDDCFENIQLREEHKSFLLSSHKSLLKKIAEEEVERLEKELIEEITETMIEDELRIFTETPHSDISIKAYTKKIATIVRDMTKNKVIQNQITHWKEIISKLNEEQI